MPGPPTEQQRSSLNQPLRSEPEQRKAAASSNSSRRKCPANGDARWNGIGPSRDDLLRWIAGWAEDSVDTPMASTEEFNQDLEALGYDQVPRRNFVTTVRPALGMITRVLEQHGAQSPMEAALVDTMRSQQEYDQEIPVKQAENARLANAAIFERQTVKADRAGDKPNGDVYAGETRGSPEKYWNDR